MPHPDEPALVDYVARHSSATALAADLSPHQLTTTRDACWKIFGP